MKHISCALLLSISGGVYGGCPVAPINTPTEKAEKLSTQLLPVLMKCKESLPANDQSPCNFFVSQGLYIMWGVDDFGKGDGPFLTANQIWDKVNSGNSNWKKLGIVLDEDNNLCAQSLANDGWPVIAVMKEEGGTGHVSLVIPGQPTESSTWGMLSANSANFRLNQPEASYVGSPLSKAFGKENAKRAVFFYRSPINL
ncbi:hypothetical protein PC510_003881 [Escherichia coli]|nr:hypothetical protein [Escherichia coli]